MSTTFENIYVVYSYVALYSRQIYLSFFLHGVAVLRRFRLSRCILNFPFE